VHPPRPGGFGHWGLHAIAMSFQSPALAKPCASKAMRLQSHALAIGMSFQSAWAWRDRTTWPARVRSASRRAGRARTSHGCLLLVLPMRLACAVGAIAGVAKTRQDIGIDVEAVVDCGCPDWHLRMDAAQTFEALR